LLDLPGLSLRGRDRDRLTLEYAGETGPLLDWLARFELTDLRIEPAGLGPIYHRYHGVQA
jgi:hypothetical protein